MELNQHINPEDAENAQKILSISESIEGADNVLSIKRHHVRDGVLSIKKVVDPDTRTPLAAKKLITLNTKDLPKAKHYAFLFNDLLVFCIIKVSKDPEAKPFSHLLSVQINKIKGITIQQHQKKKIGLVLTSGETLVISSSAKDRNLWMVDINSCMNAVDGKVSTQSVYFL